MVSAGALFGAFAGARHSFVLFPVNDPYDPAVRALMNMPEPDVEDVAPPPPPAPSPPAPSLPPPAPKSSASVVTPTAEVRSAPFDVAPVVAVLARGQRLRVQETPRAGWRVAILPDGRVGYIRQAQVELLP
jgi:hypothetical protein